MQLSPQTCLRSPANFQMTSSYKNLFPWQHYLQPAPSQEWPPLCLSANWGPSLGFLCKLSGGLLWHLIKKKTVKIVIFTHTLVVIITVTVTVYNYSHICSYPPVIRILLLSSHGLTKSMQIFRTTSNSLQTYLFQCAKWENKLNPMKDFRNIIERESYFHARLLKRQQVICLPSEAFVKLMNCCTKPRNASVSLILQPLPPFDSTDSRSTESWLLLLVHFGTDGLVLGVLLVTANERKRQFIKPLIPFSLFYAQLGSISSHFGSLVVILLPTWCGARNAGSQNGWKSSLC